MSSPDLKKTFELMKVGELRQKLGSLGLDKNGVKMVLVERLVEHFQSQKDEEDNTQTGIEIETGTGGVVEVQDTKDVSLPDNDIVATTIEENNLKETAPSAETELSVETEDIVKTVDEKEQVEEVSNTELETVEEKVPDEVEEKVVEVEEPNMNQETEQELAADDNVKNLEDDVDDSVAKPDTPISENQGNVIQEGDANANDDKEVDETSEVSDVTGIHEEKKDQEEEPDEKDNQDQEPDTSSIASKISNDNDSHHKKVTEAEDSEESKRKEGDRHLMLVTGLTSNTSANDLKTFFRKFGKIGRIRIMTNTRVPGSQRFAHITVSSMDDLKNFEKAVSGVKLQGKTIRVLKAPDDGSVASSYEIAVAQAKADEEEKSTETSQENDDDVEKESAHDSSIAESVTQNEETKECTKDESQGSSNDNDKSQDTPEPDSKDTEEPENCDATDEPSDEGKDSQTQSQSPEKKVAIRTHQRALDKGSHRSRKESHERNRTGESGYRPEIRGFQRARVGSSKDRRRFGPPRGPITRVNRDRAPTGRERPPVPGGRRRSPHAAQLTFEQIREIRDEHRRRDVERRSREEQRERAAEVERQKRMEYQNYMEFKYLEREREKLRMERERIEKEKLELIKLERERQRTEREKIEKEKEELRRAKINIEHNRHRPNPMKRPFDEKDDRRRVPEDRKKPYLPADRVRSETKTDAEQKMERDRYEHRRMHSGHHSEVRPRTPPVPRDIRKDTWAKLDRAGNGGSGRVSSSDRSHRREDVMKSERHSRDAPSRTATGPSDVGSRYSSDTGHSSSRNIDDTRPPTRDFEWMQRSAYVGGNSSLSMPMSSTATGSRESWSVSDRKIEAWDSSRLAPRTEQWISGSGAAMGGAGRSSLPQLPPPPPIYSHNSATFNLPTSTSNLGNYTTDRYDGYKGSFMRRF